MGIVARVFRWGQGVDVTFGGTPPQPHRGTLTPLIPLSLRAIKGEGEIRIEAHVRAEHARGPLIQYWGERDGFRLGGGCVFRRDGFTPWRICDLPPQE